LILDIELSKEVMKRINARPKECWNNAFDALKIYGPAGAKYVEGWAATKNEDDDAQSPLIIEHGWIEYGEVIIDPTIPDQIIQYFPGIRYDLEEALEAASQIKELPFAWHLTGDPRYSGYQEALYRSFRLFR